MKNKNTKKIFNLDKRLTIVLVILIGLSLFYVYQSGSRGYISSTNSSGAFSFEYPENWTIKPYIWSNCCEGPEVTEPDWSKESKPITLHPIEDENVIISIVPHKYGDFWKSYDDLKAQVKEDYFATIIFEGQREDGHEALFSRVDYLGPPDAKVESFTDHRYYFDSGKTMIMVDFREKYHHDWFPENNIDVTQYTADFEHIANSVNFTN